VRRGEIRSAVVAGFNAVLTSSVAKMVAVSNKEQFSASVLSSAHLRLVYARIKGIPISWD